MIGGTVPQGEKEREMVNIYVGNLSYETTEADLRNMFEAHGQVDRASVVMDRMTNRSKGFGFVEMPNDKEGNAAISAMNEMETGGRKLMVNVAKPKEDRPTRRDRY
jgi:RNA recognition motif-containing protein